MVSLYLKFAEMQANGEYQIYVRLGWEAWRIPKIIQISILTHVGKISAKIAEPNQRKSIRNIKICI